ncbi:MAG: Fe2+-dependent dioxygenase [Sphingomonadaceae bacterium]|nr:Fe2+-dependent dioxygenase [Sphingomonadaceae bacterium]
MFKRIDNVLSANELATLKTIAKSAPFVSGRISNPHNTLKNNLQLHDPEVGQQAAQIMLQALGRNEEFNNYAFPKVIAPPIIASYKVGMHYGLHGDAAFLPISSRRLRSDLSCTIFLNDLDVYDGGALRINLSGTEFSTRLPPGSLMLYPSTTLHEVTPVTRGVRLVGITFIESRIADPEHREWLYELNEVAALEGLRMSRENYTRLQRIQQNLLREWGDPS